ncbi:MAG: M48 family metallopeptidase [Gammaproteobacteria bacterium]|nr:M48 family metallopeptidase [Gammaproteobacteria bacterium]
MDFFGRQDLARRKTRLLVLYFILAVVSIVIAVNLIFASVSGYGLVFEYRNPLQAGYWLSNRFVIVTSITLGVILFGNLIVYFDIRDGGASVAEYAGATQVEMSSGDKLLKRYINIVEEMAIASGVIMPVLYVQKNEQGINAFVAGLSAENTAMVVTQGALNKLNREQLQGVIGHEFSHIFHGDMRLNVRMIGIIYGITMIGEIGRSMLRGLFHSRRRSYQQKKSNSIGAAAGFIGLGLFLAGYLGLFFGRLIRASVSRQREFLADASSVQYTRNKDGIAGALTAIMYDGAGSHLQSKKAEDIAHMCFCESMSLNGRFATHPPLAERINAISPGFLPQYKIRDRNSLHNQDIDASKSHVNSYVSSFSEQQTPVNITNKEVADSVGQPQPEHLLQAHDLLNTIPDKLHLAAYNVESARALFYAMILSSMKDQSMVSFSAIEDSESERIAALTKGFYPEFCNIGAAIRLPLIELSLPVLRGLSITDKNKFIDICVSLSALDNKKNLFEFIIVTILRAELLDRIKTKQLSRYKNIKSVLSSIERLLSLLIYAGRNAAPDKVYKRHMSRFKHTDLDIVPLSECKLSLISKDMLEVSRLKPDIKRNVLEIFIDCILDDDLVMPAEAEMLRAVSMMLDCPMPPMAVKNNRRGQ